MKLNNRLTNIAELVKNNAKVIDVGCDHALLDIYLAKTKKCLKIVASDIKTGPLEQALKNITKYQVTDKINLQLSDGLKNLDKDIDTIIISGMGGRNIIGILKGANLKNITNLILSPNNDTLELRLYMIKHGFMIENEIFAKDNKFIYPIMTFKKGKKVYTNKEKLYGPIFLKNKGTLFFEYYERELKKQVILLKFLPKNYFLKRMKLVKKINTLKTILNKSF